MSQASTNEQQKSASDRGTEKENGRGCAMMRERRTVSHGPFSMRFSGFRS